jgi:hypothetical protein
MVQRRPGSVLHRGVSRLVLGMATIGNRLIQQLCHICAKSGVRDSPLQRDAPRIGRSTVDFSASSPPPRRQLFDTCRVRWWEWTMVCEPRGQRAPVSPSGLHAIPSLRKGRGLCRNERPVGPWRDGRADREAHTISALLGLGSRRNPSVGREDLPIFQPIMRGPSDTPRVPREAAWCGRSGVAGPHHPEGRHPER